jgi:hypothetical protein|tara:strand:- start:526 stop:876 length:351 start_codon:yes stop_codon:yes gene_type:complete
MASFKMTGTLVFIGKTVQVSDKFAKREFVINDGQKDYPQDILFQLVQDKTDFMDKFELGQEVEVSFNMRGRKWTSPQGEDKYFNSLDAWRVDAVASDQTTQGEVADKQEVEDDLPF